MSEVNQILFRTPIAAVNNNDHLRVYTADVFGNIRESLYENGWKNGTIKNTVAQGKIGSAIAATSQALNEIRVYYISADNKLREAAYSANKGWYSGDLDAKNYSVAPYSKIAATFLPGNGQSLRVYVQKEDNTIQEYGYDNGWSVQTNIGAALPGTAIATTSYLINSKLSIRVYYQKPDLKVIEQAFDQGSSWFAGSLTFPAPSQTSLSAASFNGANDYLSLRVYYATNDNKLQEKALDGDAKWYDGAFVQPSIVGTNSAIIDWSSGKNLQLRVYFQNGTDVTGVSEWVYSGGWTQGVAAIPPARN